MKQKIFRPKWWSTALFGILTLCCLTSPTHAKEALAVSVLDQYVEVHTGPGRGYPVFHAIEYGETISLIKQRTDWVMIETKRGKSGWARRSELEMTLGTDDVLYIFDTPDIDDYLRRRWSGGMAAGDFGGADAMTLFLGYRFSNNLSVEAKLTQAIGNFSDSLIFGTNIVHETFPHWRVSPFFSLGAAVIQTKPDATLIASEDRTDNMLTVGAGVQAYISRRLMVRLEYTNNLILTSRNENQEVKEWKLGINVFF